MHGTMNIKINILTTLSQLVLSCSEPQ